MVKNLALLLATFIIAVAALELALRIAGVSYPAFYEEDAYLGGKLRPGAEGRFRAEGGSWVRINSDGMRDREHPVAKPPGTVRIAVLGDSFAEAMAVSVEQAFPAVIERELGRCDAGRKVEVLNFGVSGYGTAQELIMLRRNVWKYSPDIVLLAFFTGNDVRNNFRALNHDPSVPYFAYQGDRLVLDESFHDSLRSLKLSPRALAWSNFMAGVRNHSRLIQVVSEVRSGLARKAAVKAAEANDDMAASEKTAAQGGELGLDNAVYSEPASAEWKEAWRVTDGLIVAMRDEVRSHGAQLWIATLSTGIQVHPEPAVRNAFMKRLGVPDLFYPDRRVRVVAERAGIPVITLAPEMAAYAESHKTYLHGFPNGAMGFGHWNEAGNRLAGELIAKQLCGTVRSF
jgi:hypothetical protein